MGIYAMSPVLIHHRSFIVVMTTLLIWTSLLLPTRAQASFTVNTDDDVDDSACDGTHCSLREAINAANSSAGSDTISFALPGSTTITLSSPLPTVTEAVLIDGLTQTGSTCSTPVIILDGGLVTGTGLTLATSNSTIRALSITGFDGDGILVNGSNNIINCNSITANSGDGIEITAPASADNQVTQNRIATNGVNGVLVVGDSSIGNRISNNSITDNAGLGIDLGGNGISTNDALDADGSPNNFQNYPTLSTARISGSNVVVSGTLNSAASNVYTLEFFTNAACAPQLFGQGDTLAGTTNVTTDSQGAATFSINLPLVAAGTVITATATSSTNDTSEFSRCITVTVPAPQFNGSPPPGLLSLTVIQGQRASQAITMNNIGTGDLIISSYSISGDTRLSVTGPATPITLPDTGGTQTLTVACASNDIPNQNPVMGTLRITHNGAGSPATYPLECRVISTATPVYTSAPFLPGVPIDFGTVLIGSVNPTNLTIFNIGTAPLFISGGTLAGPNATEFRLSPVPPFSIQPGGSQPVVIGCAPASDGFKTATLQFNTNDPFRPIVIHGLTCVGSTTVVPTNTPGGPAATSVFPTAFVPTALGPAQGNVIEVEGLAVRTGPYLGATLIGRIEPGANYNILGKSQDEGEYTWYYVQASDTLFGWVSGRYLNLTGNIAVIPAQSSLFDQIDGAPDIGVTAIANAIIDIRRRPSTRTTILSQLPPNGEFNIIGRTRQNGGNFWLHIRYNGLVGWIPASPIDIRGSMNAVPIR
jgi:CSLREA domain-containing protein